MYRSSFCATAFVPILLLSISAPRPALAQGGGSAASRVELWGGVGLGTAPLDGSLAATYEPLFEFGNAIRTSGSQSLIFAAGTTFSVEGGLAWFPSRHVGVEFRLDRVAPTLGGTSSAHVAELTYTARYPPTYEPQQVTFRQNDPWTAPSGTSRALTMSANLAARWNAGGAVIGRVSAGVSLARLSTSAASLGFVQARLGGHSVLFAETKKLGFDLGPVSSPGFNVGGGLDVRVSHHVAVTLDGRWFRTAEATPELVFASITNPTEVIWELDLAAARARYTLNRCTLSVNRTRALVGLKLVF